MKIKYVTDNGVIENGYLKDTLVADEVYNVVATTYYDLTINIDDTEVSLELPAGTHDVDLSEYIKAGQVGNASSGVLYNGILTLEVANDTEIDINLVEYNKTYQMKDLAWFYPNFDWTNYQNKRIEIEVRLDELVNNYNLNGMNYANFRTYWGSDRGKLFAALGKTSVTGNVVNFNEFVKYVFDYKEFSLAVNDKKSIFERVNYPGAGNIIVGNFGGINPGGGTQTGNMTYKHFRVYDANTNELLQNIQVVGNQVIDTVSGYVFANQNTVGEIVINYLDYTPVAVANVSNLTLANTNVTAKNLNHALIDFESYANTNNERIVSDNVGNGVALYNLNSILTYYYNGADGVNSSNVVTKNKGDKFTLSLDITGENHEISIDNSVVKTYTATRSVIQMPIYILSGGTTGGLGQICTSAVNRIELNEYVYDFVKRISDGVLGYIDQRGKFIEVTGIKEFTGLPDGYLKLDGLKQGTSNVGYVTTNFTPALADIAKYKIVNERTYTGTNTTDFEGSSGTNAAARMYFGRSGDKLNVNTPTSYAAVTDLAINKKYTITLDFTTGDIQVDDFIATDKLYLSQAQPLAFSILGRTEDATRVSPIGNTIFHKTTIYKDNVVIHDFLPAKRVSDNVVGIYDTTNEVFIPAVSLIES